MIVPLLQDMTMVDAHSTAFTNSTMRGGLSVGGHRMPTLSERAATGEIERS